MLCIEDAIGRAARAGLDWLVHIDVDECVLPQRTQLPDFFALLPDEVEQVFFANFEAVPPHADVDNWMTTCTEFKVNPSCADDRSTFDALWHNHAAQLAKNDDAAYMPSSYFTAYASGKSAVRLRVQHGRLPVPYDVHKFLVAGAVDGVWRAPATLTCSEALEHADAPVVLHYANAGYAHWRRKCEILDGPGHKSYILLILIPAFVASGLDSCARPSGKLIMYEFEACPFCRKVREAASVLDLDLEVRPCPRETMKAYGVCDKSRFRTEVRERGGKQQFPYFIDTGLQVTLQSSDAVVEHLWTYYGAAASKPISYRIGLKMNKPPLFFLPALTRTLMHHGMLRIPSATPTQPLELWGFEASPFCRVVREALCCLELPYTLRNVAHGSTLKRETFRVQHGHLLSPARKAIPGVVQVPLLVDPNTGTTLVESADILTYLYATYKRGEAPDESWADYSTAGASATHGTLNNGLMTAPSTPTPVPPPYQGGKRWKAS